MYTSIVVKTHDYINTNPYKGCKECGYGPGALEHNTSQLEWKALRNISVLGAKSAVAKIEGKAS
jgi:hypothetical protein